MLDPPRKDAQGDFQLQITRPKAIVYVSCNPNALRNDLKEANKRLHTVCIKAFDMFPHTHHVETLVELAARLILSVIKPFRLYTVHPDRQISSIRQFKVPPLNVVRYKSSLLQLPRNSKRLSKASPDTQTRSSLHRRNPNLFHVEQCACPKLQKLKSIAPPLLCSRVSHQYPCSINHSLPVSSDHSIMSTVDLRVCSVPNMESQSDDFKSRAS